MTPMSNPLSARLRLYLVADPAQSHLDLPTAVDLALDNGVTAVQLRAKSMSDRDHLALALELAERCRRCGALFLVNDRADIALASRADGVHLGVSDLPVSVARRILGERAVIGFSPETDDQTSRAAANGANYLGVGPVFGTASKDDAGAPLGLDALRRRVEIAGVPVIGIGGIDSENLGLVRASGAVGVAVLSAILRDAAPGDATRRLSDALRNTHG